MNAEQRALLDVCDLVKQFRLGHEKVLTAVNRVSFSVALSTLGH